MMAERKFIGVLLKPLGQQHDLDHWYIDPDGVQFDPNHLYTIHYNFNYSMRPLGVGRVTRGEDGSLVVEGTLWDERLAPGLKLAIGITTRDTAPEQDCVTRSVLTDLSLVERHADPGQPPVVIDG
jgi:hypothetical protein